MTKFKKKKLLKNFQPIQFRQWPLLTVMIALSCTALSANAQNKLLDSLKAQKDNYPQNDTLRYEWEFQSALYYFGNAEKEKAAMYLDRAYQLAKKMSYADGFADYHHYMAISSNSDRKRDTAMQHARKGLQWALQASRPQKLATAYNDIGNMHITVGNGDSAVFFLLKGLPVAEQNKLHKLGTNIAYNLSAAYDILEDYSNSRDYATKAYEMAKQENDTLAMFKSLYNQATQEFKLGKVDLSKELFRQCTVFAKAMDCDGCLADIYNNLGEILFSEKRYSEALKEYNKMAILAEELKDPEYDLYLNMNRGNTLRALGRYAEAERELSKAAEIARSGNANYELSQILTFWSVLAEETNDHKKALALWKQADSLKAVLVKGESLKEIHRLEVQYQTAEKDRSLAEQKVALSERQATIRKKDLINKTLVVGCFFIVIIAILIYRNLRHRHRLSVKEKELQDQKINKLEKERQLVAAQSLVKGQEEERSRMARDLHDGIGGLLSGVKLSLSTMKGNVFLSEESARAVSTIIGQLDNSINELRRVSHNMMPEALIKYGLKETLENYCESINQSGELTIRLQTYGLEERMEQDVEIILYRIVQELLNNVIKHAHAKQVLVQLIREPGRFMLTVEDDGIGFDKENTDSKPGAGLQNIIARANYLNGSVDINTQPGQGTSVTIEGKIN